MVSLIVTLLAIALSAGLIFAGSSYLASISSNRLSSEFERAVVSNLDSLQAAFEECRVTRDSTGTRYLCSRSTSGTGGWALTTTSINAHPATNADTTTAKESLDFLRRALPGSLPSSGDFSYQVRIISGATEQKAQLNVCIVPNLAELGTKSNVKDYSLYAFRKLAGILGAGSTGLNGFTYVIGNAAIFNTCQERIVNDDLNKTSKDYPTANTFIGASKIFLDY